MHHASRMSKEGRSVIDGGAVFLVALEVTPYYMFDTHLRAHRNGR